MNLYSFLAALPALLGLAGFVLYQLLGRSQVGDEITRRIVESLRKRVPSRLKGDERLSGNQLERLLKGDQELQRLVGEQDFLLLQQALRHQFIISLTVYGLATAFCALSVVLFVRQAQAKQKLQVDHWSVASTAPNAGGLLVDLDALQVSWRSSGEPEDVRVYLENVQNSLRTAAERVPSSANSIRFGPEAYRGILSVRERNGSNRLRVVMQAKSLSFASDAFDLRVGLTILTLVDASGKLTVAALVDNTRVPFYDFQAKIVIPPSTSKTSYLSIGPNISYRFKPQQISVAARYDWNGAKGVYLGPDDARLARFQFLVDSSARR